MNATKTVNVKSQKDKSIIEVKKIIEKPIESIDEVAVVEQKQVKKPAEIGIGVYTLSVSDEKTTKKVIRVTSFSAVRVEIIDKNEVIVYEGAYTGKYLLNNAVVVGFSQSEQLTCKFSEFEIEEESDTVITTNDAVSSTIFGDFTVKVTIQSGSRISNKFPEA